MEIGVAVFFLCTTNPACELEFVTVNLESLNSATVPFALKTRAGNFRKTKHGLLHQSATCFYWKINRQISFPTEKSDKMKIRSAVSEFIGELG